MSGTVVSNDDTESASKAGVDTEAGEKIEGSMARLSLGSDNENLSPPSLDTVTEKLIGLPNEIIKRYYGNRIRCLADYAGIQHSLAWATKVDDVIQPFGILCLVPPDGRLDFTIDDSDDVPYADISAHIVRTEKLKDLALEIQSAHGCKRVGFYDGDHFVWVSCNPQPSFGKNSVITPDGRPLVYSHGTEIFRSQLLLCLAEAMHGTGVTMLEPPKGYTLEESGIHCLGIGVPPEDGSSDDSEMLNTFIIVGDYRFNAHAKGNGDIIKVDDLPLPPQELAYRLIPTLPKVPVTVQHPVLDMLCKIGESWMQDELKHSFNVVSGALVWYLRNPDRQKLCVAILKLAPSGTIVEQDWGMIRADLTYDNNEGIVRTAVPLRDSLVELGREHKCPCMALFDSCSFVSVSRSWNPAFISSISLHKYDHIVSGAADWLVTAFKSLE